MINNNISKKILVCEHLSGKYCKKFNETCEQFSNKPVCFNFITDEAYKEYLKDEV